MKVGDSVLVARLASKKWQEHIGRTGRIRKMHSDASRYRHPEDRPVDRPIVGLYVDVRLDIPLSDGRTHIWFDRSELQVI